MRTITSNAGQVLNENYRRHISNWDEQNPDNEPYSIAEWCDLESQSDPNFFRWLFNDDDISDFGSNLTDEEKKIAVNYYNSL
ncbi:MAG: hypothetical protein BGO30_08225 [Bacteroidetes bacterium 41-46]|nr:MAG: hypothetical protein BGO30_08225 [Bacteroidetes bacterium 41-46]